MGLEVVTGTSRTTTTTMMQRRHYAIIHTASARTIRSTGLLLHRHRHRLRHLGDTVGKAQLSSICGTVIRINLCLLVNSNVECLYEFLCECVPFAMSVSLVSFNPLRHARFSLRHAIVNFDVSVIVVHSLFHKLQFTYL